jgi:hypothetical protein
MEIDMPKCNVRGSSLLLAALLGSTALAVSGPALAQAKVGVTSATDGDPLGKPPSENERVLKIGIDVQANEVVTTKANDRAHLVFLDGSSLTVGPNARLTIDKFVFDPVSKTGDLAITASQGVMRFVGGKISKTNPVTINTPSGTIGIRGGIGIFEIGQRGTTANFLFGKDMTVTGQGQTQTATRPGSQIIVNTGAPPGLPSLLPPGGLAAVINRLENNSSGSGNGKSGADQKAAGSQLASTNSGSPPGQPGPGVGGGGPPAQTNNAATNAVSNTGTANPQDNVVKASSSSPEPTTPRTTQTLKGFAAGLVVETVDHHSTTQAPLVVTRHPTNLTINTNAETGKVTATILVRDINGSIFSPTNAALSLGTGHHGESFFQDDATFVTGTTDGKGTIGPAHDRHPTITRDTTALFTNAATPGTPKPFVGPGSCTCEFLTFGYWQTEITSPADSHGRHDHDRGRSSDHGPYKMDIVTQAPWVAGQIATQLPNTGQASFSGVMLGQAQNAGSAMRNVQGSYGMTYSWGQGVGSFNASFDNRSYTGGVVGTGGANFTGGFLGGNRVGTLAGAFNTSSTAGGAVVGQSGQFGIVGPGYVASGVFAGAKH